MGTRLYRSRDDRMLAGVAGGVAEYFQVDPSIVRIAWALLAFAGGFGVLLYIVMAIVVPERPASGADARPWVPDSGSPAPRPRRDDGGRTASLVIGGLLVLIGIGFLLREVIPQISFDLFWPAILVGIGVVVLLSAFRGDDRGGRGAAPPPSGPESGPGEPS